MNDGLQNQQPQMPTIAKVFSIIGLVLGILTLILCWFSVINIVALFTGIAGIILSAIGGSKAKAVGTKSGMATAGLVLSIIGTVFAVIFFLACTLCVLCAADAIGDAASDINDLGNSFDW